MLGRPNCWVPVFIMSWAGAWLKASVTMDFTMVTSSMIFEKWGRSSEISAPEFPCFENLNLGPRSLEFGLMKAAR